MNKATAIAFKIPTNATAAIPIGSVVTILNKGVGLCTISATTPATTEVAKASSPSPPRRVTARSSPPHWSMKPMKSC
jgi:hypothetical protein